MRVEIHQRRIACKVEVGGVNAKMGISNSGMRHDERVDDLLKIRRRTVGEDVISENGEELDEEKKSKTHGIFNQGNQQIT